MLFYLLYVCYFNLLSFLIQGSVSAPFTEILRPVVAQGVTVNRRDVGSIPTREDKIFTNCYIFISSLWCRGKARR